MTTSKHGLDVLLEPSLNKSTAFTEDKKAGTWNRRAGPGRHRKRRTAACRVMLQLGHKNTDLDRYIYLVESARPQRNTFLPDNHVGSGAFLPIVYDPTIGEACLKFGHIYRQTRGMYLSIPPRQGEGDTEELAAEGRAFYLRDRWRADPRPWRSRRERHGHSR